MNPEGVMGSQEQTGNDGRADRDAAIDQPQPDAVVVALGGAELIDGSPWKVGAEWTRDQFIVSPNPLLALTPDGRVWAANLRFEEYAGLPAEAVVGRPLDELWEIDEEAWATRVCGEGMARIAAEQRADGPPSSFLQMLFVRDSTDTVDYIGVDVKEVGATHRQREVSNGYRGFELSFDQIAVGMFIVGLDGRTLHVNEALCRLLGYEREEMLDLEIFSVTHPDDRQADIEWGMKAYAGEVDGWTVEKRFVRKDGREVWVLATVSFVHDATGEPLHFLAQAVDISKQKEAEEQLRVQATTDSLTGLANRAILLDRLTHAIARAGRNDESLAVLFVDLDRFKSVNDRWGHSAGDELLVQVARRLEGCVREGDTVARLGGDEFVVLCEPISAARDGELLGQRIVDVLAAPFELTWGRAQIGASVGVAVGNRSSTPEVLLRAADLAAYDAKARGRSRVMAAA
jgi:diguanylate cyclase (GGDEF)-like protein/PAS domain S-box-containing protein